MSRHPRQHTKPPPERSLPSVLKHVHAHAHVWRPKGGRRSSGFEREEHRSNDDFIKNKEPGLTGAVFSHSFARQRCNKPSQQQQEYPLEFVRLSPGAKLVQTRRSIDVEGLAEREGPDPAFVVLGGQKCGTTLLYECLNQHPLVARGRKRETHFFDWAWPAEAGEAATRMTAEKLRESCELLPSVCWCVVCGVWGVACGVWTRVVLVSPRVWYFPSGVACRSPARDGSRRSCWLSLAPRRYILLSLCAARVPSVYSSFSRLPHKQHVHGLSVACQPSTTLD